MSVVTIIDGELVTVIDGHIGRGGASRFRFPAPLWGQETGKRPVAAITVPFVRDTEVHKVLRSLVFIVFTLFEGGKAHSLSVPDQDPGLSPQLSCSC